MPMFHFQLAPSTADAHAGPQRRDQHAAGQRQLDEGAPGSHEV